MKRLVFAAAFAIACGPQQPPAAPTKKHAAPQAAADWRDRMPPSGAPRPVHFPATQRAVLANGLTVAVIPKHAGTEAIVMSVASGSAQDRAGRSGLAALTAQLLTEGTDQRSALEIAIAAEGLGSSLSADATRDASHIGLELLTGDLQEGLALLAECVRRPSFPQAEFERVRAQLVDMARGYEQDPSEHAGSLGVRYVLGGTLGMPIHGTAGTVSSIQRSDVVSFHRAQWVPGNAQLTFAGDVTLRAAVELATRAFGDWGGKAAPRLAHELPPLPAGTRILLHDRPGAVQTALFAAKHTPALSPLQQLPLEIGNHVLGGLFSSRLNTSLREKHAYTYGVGSWYETTTTYGMFTVATSVHTEHTAAAVREIFRQLDDLAKGTVPVRADEVQRARADLVQRLAASLEHVLTLAPVAEEQFVQQLAPDFHASYPARLAEVPLADVARDAQQLTSRGMTVVLVGDGDQVSQQLREHGLAYEATPAVSDL